VLVLLADGRLYFFKFPSDGWSIDVAAAMEVAEDNLGFLLTTLLQKPPRRLGLKGRRQDRWQAHRKHGKVDRGADKDRSNNPVPHKRLD